MHYYFNTETCEIIAKETADANQSGIPFTTVEELAASEVSTADMLKWVNSDKTGDARVKRFADRLSGAKRIFKELGHLTADEDAALANGDNAGTQESDGSAPTPGEASGDAPASGNRRGRKSGYAGKTIVATVKPDQQGSIMNPRREGTHGFKSMQIILDAGQISYEDYIAAGGRSNDLAWDITHGSAALKD